MVIFAFPTLKFELPDCLILFVIACTINKNSGCKILIKRTKKHWLKKTKKKHSEHVAISINLENRFPEAIKWVLVGHSRIKNRNKSTRGHHAMENAPL